MPFVSYAQNHEDVILWRALRDVERGVYVDVGAADPEEDSVTRAFYDRGWSGINVEPLDEYFNKLTQARQRDTNLKVAVGREAGVRTLHAIAGTGLSTFDPEIAARHEAAGWQAHETVVPVLTLTKILEDCAAPVIHFLKIDVEGAEAEVLEGLDLDRLRPWIIVIEATEPSSTVSTSDNWEYLVTSRGYGFAYFDGLNCFYVADEVSGLKERLAVPPNVFDEYVRWREWSLEQEVPNLHVALENLQVAVEVEKNHSANLQIALQAEQAQAENLRNALQAEQALNTTWQARLVDLQTSIRQLEAQLAVPSIDRALGRTVRRLCETGDKLTGGGIRAFAKRMLKPFSRLTTALYRLAATPPGGRAATATSGASLPAEPDNGPLPSVSPIAPTKAVTAAIASFEPKGEPLPPEDPIVATLPVSARSTYLNLRSAISNCETRFHSQ